MRIETTEVTCWNAYCVHTEQDVLKASKHYQISGDTKSTTTLQQYSSLVVQLGIAVKQKSGVEVVFRMTNATLVATVDSVVHAFQVSRKHFSHLYVDNPKNARIIGFGL